MRRQYVDDTTGKPVDEKDEVKGYEIGKDEFLLVEEDEIEAVQIESSHTLNVERFVKKSEIEQIYLDTPYYLTPADEVRQEAFAVIRKALADRKMAGLARIVLYRRERPVVVEPFDKGMLLTTLRYDKHGAPAGDVFDDVTDAEARRGDDRTGRRMSSTRRRASSTRRNSRTATRARCWNLIKAKKTAQETARRCAGAEAFQRGRSVRCAEEEPCLRGRQGAGKRREGKTQRREERVVGRAARRRKSA